MKYKFLLPLVPATLVVFLNSCGGGGSEHPSFNS